MDVKGKFNWRTVGTKRQIKIGPLIDKGVRSQIYRGVFDGRERAVKSILFDGNKREVEILHKLDHPNIIRIFFTDQRDNNLFIVLDLCQYTLEQYVKEKDHSGIKLSPVEVLRQTTDGLDYLHNGQKFCTVHRDLKPSNILFQYIDRDVIWRVKISDFGISKEFRRGKTSTMSELKGTFGFIAPELLDRADGSRGHGKIRKETDMFSFGVIFHLVLSDGKYPFGNVHDVAAIRDAEPILDIPDDKYKDESEHLIIGMLEKDYKKRIAIEDVKAHHIFWDAERKIDFLQKVSNFFEDRKLHEEHIKELEKMRDEITGGTHWKDQICGENFNPEVKKTIEKRKGWKGKKSLQDLLRLIRNWTGHFFDPGTTSELQEELGGSLDEVVNFFTSKFPKLLPHVYQFMRRLKEKDVFKNFYEAKRSTTIAENNGVINEESSSAANEASPIEDARNYAAEDSQSEFSDEDLPEDILDTTDDEGEEENSEANGSTLILREYQKELAEQALQGYNSLIIAPTGSGKTAVANEIIKNHLISGKAKAILFFVSKTTLARQQYDYFTKHLRGHIELNEIAFLIGEITTNIAVGAVINRMKLTILTPQILIDELERDKSHVSFDDVSMMIFDECHNATKKHPYKVIMDMLLDFQFSSASAGQPIQIVGMTASPGVGKGKTRDEVLENLLTLLANLNVTMKPALVVKNIDELKLHQSEIAEHYERVSTTMDRFANKIVKGMGLIEDQIEKKGMFGRQAGQFRKPPMNKDNQKYENWVMDLINHAKLKVDDRKLSRLVNLYASHLKMYHRLLYFKKLIPNAMDVTDKQETLQFDQEGPQGDFLRKIKSKLEKISREADVPIPMLDKLFKILQEEFRQSEDSRCILFVPRRPIAQALEEAILDNENLVNLRPKPLTGSNEHQERGGMTKSDQADNVRAFREGKSKILIATSVAEEGLDIPACNLVIMYSYVTGEVGRIQRGGRGRAKNSRSILLTPYGSDQIEREKTNACCELATKVALQDLDRLSDDDREQKIREIQKSQRRDRQENILQKQRLLEEASKWKILCGQCRELITNADQLQHIKNQHIFVMDNEFLNRVTRYPCEPKPIAPGVPFDKVATFSCRKRDCVHHLGLEMQHNGKTYPTLSVKQLVFENDMGERRIAKQWSKCPFAVKRAVDDPSEVDEKKLDEFVASLRNASSKGFIAEDVSDDEAMQALDMANSS